MDRLWILYQFSEYKDRSSRASQLVVSNIAALSDFMDNKQWADLAGHIGYDARQRENFYFFLSWSQKKLYLCT